MGHLCFDWSIPSDHMLGKAKAGAGLSALFFPEEPYPQGWEGRESINILDRDHFPVPATEPACS